MTAKLQPYQGSYLTPSLEKATVADAMRTRVMSCEPDLPAATAARMTATHHIQSVVVQGIHQDPVHGERLSWSVVSDMDLPHAARAGIEDVTVGEIATEPVTVEPSLPQAEALRLMEVRCQRAACLAERLAARLSPAAG